jgi:hypothetical protein
MATKQAVPLVCYTCENNPVYSDLSHLLTHVSSKGHLQTQFKLQVQDSENSRQLLSTYDKWFTKYNIGSMLSDRMNQKESNLAKKVKRPSAPKKEKKNSLFLDDPEDDRRRQAAAPKPVSYPDGHIEITDTPVAVGKTHAPKASSKQVQHGHPSSLTHKHTIRNPPPLHLWPTKNTGKAIKIEPAVPGPRFLPQRLLYQDQGHTDRARRGDSDLDAPYDKHVDPFIDYDAERQIVSSPTTVPETHKTESDDEPENSGDWTKLKGVYWPGMGIFDSATKQGKRIRNQKKDGSVLAQMIKTSAEVQPTEQIYSETGELRRERLITGFEEDREFSQPKQSPGKRTSRSKKKRVNTLMIAEDVAENLNTHEGDVKLSGTQDNGKQLRRAFGALQPNSQITSRNDVRRYLPTHDEDDEFRELFSQLPTKRKSFFTIFDDNEDKKRFSTKHSNVGGSSIAQFGTEDTKITQNSLRHDDTEHYLELELRKMVGHLEPAKVGNSSQSHNYYDATSLGLSTYPAYDQSYFESAVSCEPMKSPDRTGNSNYGSPTGKTRLEWALKSSVRSRYQTESPRYPSTKLFSFDDSTDNTFPAATQYYATSPSFLEFGRFAESATRNENSPGRHTFLQHVPEATMSVHAREFEGTPCPMPDQPDGSKGKDNLTTDDGKESHGFPHLSLGFKLESRT